MSLYFQFRQLPLFGNSEIYTEVKNIKMLREIRARRFEIKLSL